MVDFAALNARMRAERTPEENARIDALLAEERALEAATRPISSHWTYSAFNDPRDPKSGTHVYRTETKEIGIRIEPAGTKGRDYGIIRFTKGATGHEAYRLDADFCRDLIDPSWKEPENFYICAGTVGSWPMVRVATKDVVAFLDAERPEMMADARAALGLPAKDGTQAPADERKPDEPAAKNASGPAKASNEYYPLNSPQETEPRKLAFRLTGFAEKTSGKGKPYYVLTGTEIGSAGKPRERTILAWPEMGRKIAAALTSEGHEPEKLSADKPAEIALSGKWQKKPYVTGAGARKETWEFQIEGFQIGKVIQLPAAPKKQDGIER